MSKQKKEVDGLQKQCGIGCGTGCHAEVHCGTTRCKHSSETKSESNFYLGVIDCTRWKVHYDVFSKRYVYTRVDMNHGGPVDYSRRAEFRLFTDRFSKTIKDTVVKSIQLVQEEFSCFMDKMSSWDPEVVMANLDFNTESNCFTFEDFRTIGTNRYPKECQWNEFYAGHYEFFVNRFEIQVLKTELTNVSLGILKDVSEAVRTAYDVPSKDEIEVVNEVICVEAELE